ncbi:MAG: tetratricopeptide repeat protein [Acidobacteriota bacterium]|nr:tetratricopeptide repeat protein [Acidobacteriota bacterium]
MAFNREEALRAAEKSVAAGKIEQAITEYASILERQPRDLSTANTLGDLYARAGQAERAVAEYIRIGEHYLTDGFLPKAAALFKKALKLQPDNEESLLHLGRIAGRQGLLADARSYMNTVVTRRRARGDAWAADDVLIELAQLDPGDVDARMLAARTLAARGAGADAAAGLRELAIHLLEKERALEAVDVLREAVHMVPDDRLSRRQLVNLLNDLDQASEAEAYLTRDVAGDDPVLLLAVARVELETGRLDEGREDIRRALGHAPGRDEALRFMQQISPRLPDAGFIVAEALADAAVAGRRVSHAVEVLRWFIGAVPAHAAAPLRLIEICLEENLEHELPQAQTALADAYLATGQHSAARMIAEDLAAASPGDEAARELLARVYAAAGLEPRPASTVASPADSALPATPATRAEPAVPAEPVWTDEDFIASLLQEEASREAPAAAPAPAALPEIDLTSSLDSLDAPAADAPPVPLEAGFEGVRERNKVEETERAEAQLEEAQLAAALGQAGDAERLYAEAARVPVFRFRAAAALARLLRDQGRLADAIEWFERAGEAPAPDRDTGLALLYDLGDTLERHGEAMRAMAIFMELNADAADYRGVAARIDRIARAEIGG